MGKLKISVIFVLALSSICLARTYYVRPDGSDNNSGMFNSPEAAWKTIEHAAKNVKPGDTVEVQEGTYQGGVVINVRGEEELPITFKAVGKVIINTTNEGYSKYCICISGKYVIVDGFDLSKGGYWGGSIFLSAGSSHNIIRNNIIHDSLTGVGVWQADNNLIINNTFYKNGTGVFVHHSSDPGYSDNNVIARNLFYGNRTGILVARAKGTKILGNVIHSSTGSGISLTQAEFGNARYLTTETLIEHNIITNISKNKTSIGIKQEEKVTKTEMNLNDVWGNEGGNYSGLEPGATDISEDPLFLSIDEKSFVLKPESPCFKKDIFPSPTAYAGSGKWGLLENYLGKEYEIKDIQTRYFMGKDGIDLFIKASVVSRTFPVKVSLKVELVSPGGKVFHQKKELSLTKIENDIELTISVPEAEEGNYKLSLSLQKPDGKELCNASLIIPGISSIKLQMLKPAYRNTLFTSAKDKNIVLQLMFDGLSENLNNKELSIVLKDHREKEKILVNKKKLLTDSQFTFSAEGLTSGNYTIICLLQVNNKTIDRKTIPLRIIEPIPGYTFVDDEGNLFVDGKPFYPVGMYNAHPLDYKYLKEAGFNSITYSIGYNFKDISGIKKSLDEAFSYNFRINVASMIGNFMDRPRAGYLSSINDILPIVENIKTHPSIFTWLICEEMGYTPSLEKLYEILLENDPYHPVSTNGDLGSGFSSLYNITDIFQRHYYPYPLYKNTADENWQRIERTLNTVKNTVKICHMEQVPTAPGKPLADHKKPFFYWPQYFWGGYWASGGVGRFLTYLEMRYLVWCAFMEGAGGIYWWAYWHDYTNPRLNPSLWEGIRAIASEMSSLEPVLTSQEAIDVKVSPLPEKNFHWRAKKYNGEIYIFAGWSGENPLTVSFSLPENIQTNQVLVWSQQRSIPVINNQFQDVLNRGEIMVYTTSRTRKPSKAMEFLKDPFFIETPSYEPIQGNLAYGQPARNKEGKAVQIGATSSTSKTYTWFGHNYFAIDGDPHTCWFPVYDGNLNPAWDNPAGKDSQWLEVTFPEKKTISRIVVKSYLPRHWNDPPCNLQEYDLQYLDEKKEWKTIIEVRDNKKEVTTHTFAPLTTSKIRLLVHKGLYLSELEAYEK